VSGQFALEVMYVYSASVIIDCYKGAHEACTGGTALCIINNEPSLSVHLYHWLNPLTNEQHLEMP